ncbi:MAG: imidazolonepropionase [Bacillota bacterium]
MERLFGIPNRRPLGVMEADFLIRNIGQLLTLDGDNAPRRGAAARDLGVIENVCLAAQDGVVVAIGPEEEILKTVLLDKNSVKLDAAGGVVCPGFVDPHTHLVFGGWRHEEYSLRCQGASYLEIAEKGGGINSTVAATRAASYEELSRRTFGFLDQMLSYGTTSCEAKSGYGLDAESEAKQLHVARRCSESHAIDVVNTYLGAHAVPPEFKDDRQGYVREVIGMLPAIKGLDLARFVDVFCDAGAFTIDETREILEAARDLGFGLKVHADELERTGATELACELGAVSCDHLLKVGDAGIDALAGSNTVAVLLPATSCFLGKFPGAPARRLLDSGVAVALGTDFNPGTSTAMSMPLAMTLACSTLGMSPEEAFVASTWNAAWAAGLGGKTGALAPGYPADALILRASHYAEVPYRFGVNLVDTVVKRGRVVYREGGHERRN